MLKEDWLSIKLTAFCIQVFFIVNSRVIYLKKKRGIPHGSKSIIQRDTYTGWW